MQNPNDILRRSLHCHIAKQLQPILQLLLPPWQEAKRLPPCQEAEQSMQGVRSHSNPASLFLEQLLAAKLTQSLSTAAGGVSIYTFIAKLPFFCLFSKEKSFLLPKVLEKKQHLGVSICLHFAHPELGQKQQFPLFHSRKNKLLI